MRRVHRFVVLLVFTAGLQLAIGLLQKLSFSRVVPRGINALFSDRGQLTPLKFAVVEEAPSTAISSRNNVMTPSSSTVAVIPTKFGDLCELIDLRISVFYPAHRKDLKFHAQLLEKIQRRFRRGTYCLSAVCHEEPFLNPLNSRDSSPQIRLIPSSASISSSSMSSINRDDSRVVTDSRDSKSDCIDITALLEESKGESSERSPDTPSREGVEFSSAQKTPGLAGNLIGTIEFNDFDFANTSLADYGSTRKLYVADLAIREDFRRLGIATSLLQAVELFAERHGYDELYLHVEAFNKVARKLYSKLGYAECTRTLEVMKFTEAHLMRAADSYDLLSKKLHTADAGLTTARKAAKSL